MSKRKDHQLVSIDDLDSIMPDQLLGNKTAIVMLLREHKRITDETQMLKQDLNRQATFERALSIRKNNAKISAMVSFLASLSLSFGVGMITSSGISGGNLIVFMLGIILEVFSLYLSFCDKDSEV